MDTFSVYLASTAVFVNNYCISNVIPYAAAMVLKYELVDHIDKAGYYAGLLASSFFFARIFTAFFWGQIADDFGRRPVFLMANFTSGFISLLFGLTTSFEAALFVRVLFGFFGAHWMVAKTIVGESCDVSEQKRGLGYLSAFANLGVVVGTTFGGWFSFIPKESQELELFKTLDRYSPVSLESYPFLLPNLFGSVVSFVVFFLALFFLKETKAKPIAKQEEEEEGLLESTKPKDLSHKQRETTKSRMSKYIWPCGPACKLLGSSEVRISCVLFLTYSFVDLSFTEILSLWIQATKESKGFGFSVQLTGTVLGIASIMLVVFMMVIFPWFSHFKATSIFLSVVFFASLLLLVLPQVPVLLQDFSQDINLAVIVFLTGVWCCCNSMIFTSMNAFVTNSCDKERGALNGLTICLTSLGKSIGPFLCAQLFAWSLTNEKSYPLDNHLVFYLLSLCLLLLAAFGLFIPMSLNSPSAKLQDF